MNLDNLVIIGAGGFGRELFEWAAASPDYGRRWNIKGFIDDAPREKLRGSLRVPVLGPISSYEIEHNDVFVCGIGIPYIKRKLCEMFAKQGAKFISLVHPSAVVCKSASIGPGVIICPYSLISADATIGDGSVVYYHSSVDHDSSIGRFCQISGHCDIAGGAKIGEEVFLGSHSVILPGVVIGNGVTVGAGAVVTKDVSAGLVVYGVPARPRFEIDTNI